MAQYTLPQCPELSFQVAGKESDRARYEALKQIVKSINSGKLKIELPEGFSTCELIEITEQDLMAEGEDKIIEAVKALNKLSSSKQKVQELHEQALKASLHLDALFSNRSLTEEEYKNIEEGLKIIKDFAQANLRYKQVLPDAEKARSLLDEALKNPEE